MNTADDKPVTQRELDVGLRGLRDEMKSEMQSAKDELRNEMRTMKDEILDHFDATAENIHKDVAGANHDEISLIKDKADNHEERIVALEQ